MRKMTTRILALLLVTLFIGCSEPESISEAERVTNLLKASGWKVSSVQVDGLASTLFTGMTLTFTNTSFSSTNATPVWPATGSWSFQANSTTNIKRSDGVDVVINSISETSLVLSLNWTKKTFGNGKSESIAGQHLFSLTK